MARDLNCSVSFAKGLLDAYWKKNWSVLKIAEDVEVKSTGKSMWLKNPVSGFWYQLRYDKDRFSTLNQGTGVFCFDTWVYFVRKLGVAVNGQWHDEILFITKGDNLDKLQEAIELANKKLNLNVPLGVDVKTGSSYAEVH